MAYGERQKRFGFSKREALPKYCLQFPHLILCWGECPKNRFVRTPDGEPGFNYLCAGLLRFYGPIQRDLSDIVRRVRKEQAMPLCAANMRSAATGEEERTTRTRMLARRSA